MLFPDVGKTCVFDGSVQTDILMKFVAVTPAGFDRPAGHPYIMLPIGESEHIDIILFTDGAFADIIALLGIGGLVFLYQLPSSCSASSLDSSAFTTSL